MMFEERNGLIRGMTRGLSLIASVVMCMCAAYMVVSALDQHAYRRAIAWGCSLSMFLAILLTNLRRDR